MKLTIGMIVKNEEKWLEKCLTAIKPILDNVDSELIITDTGSTDKTVEIAKRYTNKVLHFDWVKDFSAARNHGLSKAQGEWFMMLDADDIFRSSDNIIDFFNSGEYRNYNAASYLSRNLVKTEHGIGCSDLWAPRLVKITKDTKYIGCVHEYLSTFEAPFKNINDIADHYGYLYENDEARKNKFKRNSELLLKRYESEKDTSPMLYVQLYEAYMAVEDYDTAMRYLEEGMVIARKLNSIVLVALYFHKSSFYYTEKQYENAISQADEYFKINKIIRPHVLNTDAEIYAIKATSNYKLEKFNEAIIDYKSFFELYRDIESGKIATYDAYLISNFMCTDINWLPLFNNYIECCIKCGKINTADSCFRSFPISRYSYETEKVKQLVRLELEVAKYFSYKNIFEYYKKHNDYGKSIFKISLINEMLIAQNKSDIINALTDISKKENSEDNNTALKAAETIAGAQRLQSERRYKECISELKQAITIYEPIAQIISEYCNNVVSEYEQYSKPSDSKIEMQKLANAIKNNIRAYIDAGNIVAGRQTLDEFKQLLPDDAEINDLEFLIKQKGGETA